MQLFQTANFILNQLLGVVEQISESDFQKRSAALNATIGQHLRHTLEFFICLMQGYETGLVNYDKRIHDKTIESDKFIALNTIKQIKEFMELNQTDKSLTLEVGYLPDSEDAVSISTNYLRELTYNIEHSVHHMAIMKIGIQEVANYIQLPFDFGIAVSTIRHKHSEVTSH